MWPEVTCEDGSLLTRPNACYSDSAMVESTGVPRPNIEQDPGWMAQKEY